MKHIKPIHLFEKSTENICTRIKLYRYQYLVHMIAQDSLTPLSILATLMCTLPRAGTLYS